MHGKAKEQAEIDGEKEIVKTATIQAMGKNKYGNVTQNELEEKLNSNAGEGKTEVIDDGDILVVKFTESNRYYEVDSNGNVSSPIEIIIDKYPGDITKDKDGNELGGTEESPYEIWCVEDLVAFSKSGNEGNNFGEKYISLMRTLDFASVFSYSDSTTKEYDLYLGGDGTIELKTQLSSNGIGFKSINSNSKNFYGTFDGKGNKILNLYGKGSLFGNIYNATIKNLEVYGIIQDNTAAGMITNATNSYIINCSNYANISAQAVGGICKTSSSSSFYNCYNVGTISGKWQTGVGGIVGEANNGTIIYNSYNLGNITLTNGNSYAAAGGIVGYIRRGNITIENCYNIGNISSSRYKGGIVGGFSGDNLEINNCYFLNDISNGVGNLDGGTSVTLEQIKSKELINDKYIIDIFNDFVEEYNGKECLFNLKYWNLGENGFPSFK